VPGRQTVRSIILATHNPSKLREFRTILSGLSIEVFGLDEFSRVDPPEETGMTFAENAREKATYYARATRSWCLADDSGLVVDALGGQPGVLSARYAADRLQANASGKQVDQANIAKLLEKMAAVPQADRAARFVCCLALSDGRKTLAETTAVVEGQIALAPRGNNGFGYDPVFIADEAGCTMAQLSAEQKHAISHRGKAARQFAGTLKEILVKQ